MNISRWLFGNYWMMPAVMTVTGLAGAMVLTVVGNWIDVAAILSPIGFSRISPEGARSILAVVASSTITVAGVVFSITTLAMANMSSQYGARVLTNFMDDRGSQMTLGIFVGTFAYCLMVLGQVRAADEVNGPGSVPQLALLGGLLLMLVSLGALIYYIHHAADSLRIQTQTGVIGRRLAAAIDSRPSRSDQESEPDWDAAAACRADQAGYVQRVDLTGLTDLALESNGEFRVIAMPGDFVVEGARLAQWLGQSDGVPEQWRDCFKLGNRRTGEQDFTYHFDELVEIAVRSLSPSVNDPFVAGNCMSWIADGLIRFHQNGGSQWIRHDDEGQARVHLRRLEFRDVFEGTCSQLIQYFAGDRNAALTFLSALHSIHEQVGEERLILAMGQRLVDAAGSRLDEGAMTDLNRGLDRLRTGDESDSEETDAPRSG